MSPHKRRGGGLASLVGEEEGGEGGQGHGGGPTDECLLRLKCDVVSTFYL